MSHRPTRFVSASKRYDAPEVVDITPMYAEAEEQKAESHDSAVSIAGGSLLYSIAYMVVFGVIVVALAALVWWFSDDSLDLPLLGMGSLLLWGGGSYLILYKNREQGLEHSPTGIEHAKIESKERVALRAIDAHIYLTERQWERQDNEAGAARQIPGH